MGDNGLKEVQQGARADGFALTDLNRPRGPVPLSLVNKALRIGHNRVVDENVEVILRFKVRSFMRQFAIDKGTPKYYALVKKDKWKQPQWRCFGNTGNRPTS